MWFATAPRARANVRLTAAVLIAIVVEFSRLHHAPWLDAFRHSALGALTIGVVLLSIVALEHPFGGISRVEPKAFLQVEEILSASNGPD